MRRSTAVVVIVITIGCGRTLLVVYISGSGLITGGSRGRFGSSGSGERGCRADGRVDWAIEHDRACRCGSHLTHGRGVGETTYMLLLLLLRS